MLYKYIIKESSKALMRLSYCEAIEYTDYISADELVVDINRFWGVNSEFRRLNNIHSRLNLGDLIAVRARVGVR